MWFRAQVTNSNLLRIVQCIERLAKTAVLKLTPTGLHIVVPSDTDSGLQMWSDIDPQVLFSSYRVESLHNIEIHLKVHIDNMQRALHSAHSSHVQRMSSTGHTTRVCQDILVRVLTPDHVRAMREPEVSDVHVHSVVLLAATT